MAVTSLRLPNEWKERVQAVAAERGVTPHAFLIESIQQATVSAEKRAAFLADAEAARQETLAGGLTYEADSVHAYIRDRVNGAEVSRPQGKPWPD